MTSLARGLLAACAMAGTLCLTAQTARDDYREAYRAWRQADPEIESDAGSAGSALAARTEKAVGLAAIYYKLHSAMLHRLADEQASSLQWLRDNAPQPLPDLAPAMDEIGFANRESSTIAASAATVANDPDRAIQRLRQAFQREQTALDSLKAAIVERQQSEDNAIQAVSAAEQAWATALSESTFVSSALTQTAGSMDQEASAWAAYYPKLAQAAEAAVAPPEPATDPAGAVSAPAPPAPGPDELEPAPPRASITPLPLSRYVGVWSYQAGGEFHGPEPVTVDVTVHEDNGHATGTLSGRFKQASPGGPEAVVRFEFSGDFRATRNQTFALQTSEGAMGKIDLIPGGPLNVIEVSFEIQGGSGPINQGDMLLVKQ